MKAHVTAVALGVLAMTGACQHTGDAARSGADKPVADNPVPDAAAQRRLPADFSWRFHLGEVADGEKPLLPDADWRTVDLPHDWSMEGAFDPKNPMGGVGGFLPAGIGWYRRSFNAPEDWRGKRIGVEFEGVYMNAEETSKLAVFEGKRIRKTLHESEWWFLIIEKAGDTMPVGRWQTGFLTAGVPFGDVRERLRVWRSLIWGSKKVLFFSGRRRGV